MEEDFSLIEEEAYKILMTWSKEDLVTDILTLTSKEGLREFVKQNEINDREDNNEYPYGK